MWLGDEDEEEEGEDEEDEEDVGVWLELKTEFNHDSWAADKSGEAK